MQEKIKNWHQDYKVRPGKIQVKIEYTTRDTPQQNSSVEVAFYALTNKMCATMHHANLPMEMWYQLFGEIFTTVTLLDGLTVIESNGKSASRYEHFWRNAKVCVKFAHGRGGWYSKIQDGHHSKTGGLRCTLYICWILLDTPNRLFLDI